MEGLSSFHRLAAVQDKRPEICTLAWLWERIDITLSIGTGHDYQLFCPLSFPVIESGFLGNASVCVTSSLLYVQSLLSTKCVLLFPGYIPSDATSALSIPLFSKQLAAALPSTSRTTLEDEVGYKGFTYWLILQLQTIFWTIIHISAYAY